MDQMSSSVVLVHPFKLILYTCTYDQCVFFFKISNKNQFVKKLPNYMSSKNLRIYKWGMGGRSTTSTRTKTSSLHFTVLTTWLTNLIVQFHIITCLSIWSNERDGYWVFQKLRTHTLEVLRDLFIESVGILDIVFFWEWAKIQGLL